jgi:hypothetical protein
VSDFLKEYLDLRFQALEEKIMSQITDKVAEINVSLDAALVRVQEDVDALKAQVADLEAKVAGGVATPEDLAVLDALKARIDALDPTSPAVLPPEEPPTE